MGAGPTGEARSLRAVCFYPRGRGLWDSGGPACPPQSVGPGAKCSAQRLRRPRTASCSPALQGRAHPLPLPAVGALASDLNLVSQPLLAPTAHPALSQVPADPNGMQRGLCFSSSCHRRTRPCPLFLDPREGWTPRPLLFAPYSLSAPIVGQIHPEVSEILWAGILDSLLAAPQLLLPAPGTCQSPTLTQPLLSIPAPPPGPSSSPAPPELGWERRQLEEKG